MATFYMDSLIGALGPIKIAVAKFDADALGAVVVSLPAPDSDVDTTFPNKGLGVQYILGAVVGFGPEATAGGVKSVPTNVTLPTSASTGSFTSTMNDAGSGIIIFFGY